MYLLWHQTQPVLGLVCYFSQTSDRWNVIPICRNVSGSCRMCALMRSVFVHITHKIDMPQGTFWRASLLINDLCNICNCPSLMHTEDQIASICEFQLQVIPDRLFAGVHSICSVDYEFQIWFRDRRLNKISITVTAL